MELIYQIMSTKPKGIISKSKCHRLGCNGSAERGIRDKMGYVIVFCRECFQELIRHDIIDGDTGQLLAS
jgi:hypothetical protein